MLPLPPPTLVFPCNPLHRAPLLLLNLSRFLRLALQLGQRYKTWAAAAVASRKSKSHPPPAAAPALHAAPNASPGPKHLHADAANTSSPAKTDVPRCEAMSAATFQPCLSAAGLCAKWEGVGTRMCPCSSLDCLFSRSNRSPSCCALAAPHTLNGRNSQPWLDCVLTFTMQCFQMCVCCSAWWCV